MKLKYEVLADRNFMLCGLSTIESQDEGTATLIGLGYGTEDDPWLLFKLCRADADLVRDLGELLLDLANKWDNEPRRFNK